MSASSYSTLFVRLIWTSLLFCPVASAEVMDKVPQTFNFWGCTLLSSLLLFGLVKLRSWWGLLLGSLPGLAYFCLVFEEIYSPDIEQAIRAEAGSIYFVHFYAALVGLMLIILVCQALVFRSTHNQSEGKSAG
ncbi:MAG: hypothetical protein QE278_04145 [Limnobacter sp.]|nr:hypothetical protein [Limnobacter sp.]